MSMSKIQAELKAPKGQFNSFGKYKYRSCEDIVEAVKPILAKYGYHLNMNDDIRVAGDRVYVEAICRVMEGEKVVSEAHAFAREPDDKKGMDSSQITGTASSYARKYALNGLFAIDDTKDADTDEHRNQVNQPTAKPDKAVLAKFQKCQSVDELQSLWSSVKDKKLYEQAKNEAKERLAA